MMNGFHDKPHPHDSMPIATDDNTYASRHETTPDFEKDAEEIVTMHEKAYRIATAKYNPFCRGIGEYSYWIERIKEETRTG